MASGEDRARKLTALGEAVLAALAAVENAARSALSSGAPAISLPTLVYPSNRIVGDDKPERFVAAQNAEAKRQLRLLLNEPFIARVKVDWGQADGGVQTFYFPSRSAGGLSRAIDGAYLVSYLDDLGRLAEYDAGQLAEIEVRGRERRGRILECSVIEPTAQDGLWDALVHEFSATPWGDVLVLFGQEHLRAALDRLRGRRAVADEDIVGQLERQAADAERQQQRLRRRVIDRVALRNRPVLDRFQGDIFRLPLDRQVILFGPPGSGKTTTLIKRLARKRTPDALPESEQELLSDSMRETLARSDSWAMFSPAELLKQYLSDAFAKNGIPDSGNVRTWDQERHELGRQVLNILRSGSGGRFQFETNPNWLLDPSSRGLAKLHDEFAIYFETLQLERATNAMANLLAASDERVRRAAQAMRRTLGSSATLQIPDIFRLLDGAESLQTEQTRLAALVAEEIRSIANGILNRHKTLPDEIAAEVRTLAAEEQQESEGEESEEDEIRSPAVAQSPVRVLQSALRGWARAMAEKRETIGGRSERIINLIGSRLPAPDQFAAVGNNLALLAHLRTLIQAPRRLVFEAPTAYAAYRREAAKQRRHFSDESAHRDFLSRSKITPDEVDVLILIMLRYARRLLLSPGPRQLELSTPHEWLERIKERYLMQVFVDEATDLSIVQLACTAELTYPSLRSWFACGDLRQRITANGIRDEAELEWLRRTTGIRLDLKRIDVGYRQSRQLRELSDALGTLLDGVPARTAAPHDEEEVDVPPLLAERLAPQEVAEWLAQRIREVELSVGASTFPAIAIFVDGDERVASLAQATENALASWNVVVKGRTLDSHVGEAREVRVFDINNIKGMEFEAAFFIGIDRLAERAPDLFARFLYVGLTRAATYLGVTCEGSLPPDLEPIRSRFGSGGWLQA